MRRIIYRKKRISFAHPGHQVIGRKEVGKAKSLRRIHEKWYENGIAQHFMPQPGNQKGLWKAGLRIWVTNSALRTSSSAIKKVIQGGIARMGTNSALRASSSAIKSVTKGRIAHLGHQFGTSCLNPAIKWEYKSEIASKFGINSWQLLGQYLYFWSSNQSLESCEKVTGKCLELARNWITWLTQ